MLTITFDEKEYTDIPESYSELTLGRFMKTAKIKREDYKSPTEWTAVLVSTLIGCPLSTLYDLDFSDLNTLMAEFKWITDLPIKKDIRGIELDGKFYMTKKSTQLTTGEWISIESLLTEELSNEDNFHIVLAILLREEVEGKITELDGDIDVIMARAKLFQEKLMIDQCYGLITNFSNGGRKSTLKITRGSGTQKDQSQVN